jgi:hypothetical protein
MIGDAYTVVCRRRFRAPKQNKPEIRPFFAPFWRMVGPPATNGGPSLEGTVIAPAGSLRFVLPAFEHQQLDRLVSETTKQNSSIGYPLLPINA